MLILNDEFFIQTQGVWISSQTSHRTRHEYFSPFWGTKMPQQTALIVFTCYTNICVSFQETLRHLHRFPC